MFCSQLQQTSESVAFSASTNSIDLDCQVRLHAGLTYVTLCDVCICCCSSSIGDGRETMDEHMAALALTSLSCSPASPMLQSGFADFQRTGMLLRDVSENLKTEMRPRLRPSLISQRQDNSKVCLETETSRPRQWRIQGLVLWVI